MKVVSEFLGHGSPASTMTVFHVLPGMQADVAPSPGSTRAGPVDIALSDAVLGP